jgi:hypothetical protein
MHIENDEFEGSLNKNTELFLTTTKFLTKSHPVLFKPDGFKH